VDLTAATSTIANSIDACLLSYLIELAPIILLQLLRIACIVIGTIVTIFIGLLKGVAGQAYYIGQFK